MSQIVSVRGKGISVYIVVKSIDDQKIVWMAMALARKRELKRLAELTKGESK